MANDSKIAAMSFVIYLIFCLHYQQNHDGHQSGKTLKNIFQLSKLCVDESEKEWQNHNY